MYFYLITLETTYRNYTRTNHFIFFSCNRKCIFFHPSIINEPDINDAMDTDVTSAWIDQNKTRPLSSEQFVAPIRRSPCQLSSITKIGKLLKQAERLHSGYCLLHPRTKMTWLDSLKKETRQNRRVWIRAEKEKAKVRRESLHQCFRCKVFGHYLNF